jgi:hypothetical protein
VLDLSVAAIHVADGVSFEMPGETEGIQVLELVGKPVTALLRDDVYAPIIVLEPMIFLKDANDGCYGNPLRAGFIYKEYTETEVSQFVDYWTEKAIA